MPRRRPDTHYVKTEDDVHIGYQVVGDGPYDLVVNDGWLSNVDANWDLPPLADFLAKLGRTGACDRELRPDQVLEPDGYFTPRQFETRHRNRC